MDIARQELLLVAAEGREFRGILRNCESSNDLDLPIAFAKRAKMGDRSLTCVADGPGPALATRALKAIQEKKERFDAVVSTGYCGALVASLPAGSIVVATSVLDVTAGRHYPARTISTGTGSGFTSGMIASEDRVAITQLDKSRLKANSGAIAVEMEAAAVARIADESDLPFYCVRVVSDSATEEFCIDMNAMRDGQGRFKRSRILAAALQSPFVRIPALARLDRNCRAAEASLGEFFANCSFL